MLHSRQDSIMPKNTMYADTVTLEKEMPTKPTSSTKKPMAIITKPLHMFAMRRVRVTFAVLHSRMVVRGALGTGATTSATGASAMFQSKRKTRAAYNRMVRLLKSEYAACLT